MRKQQQYLPVKQSEVEAQKDEALSSNSNVMARFRLIAIVPAGAICDCIVHPGASGSGDLKLLEDCVVGGILWKLQQFCRSQQSKAQEQAKFWRNNGILLGVYVLFILGLGLVLDGNNNNNNSQQEQQGAEEQQDEDIIYVQQNINRLWVGIGVLAATALYFLVLVFLGAKLGISQTFRLKLENLIQEISEQIEPLGLQLTLDDNAGGWFLRSRHIYVALKKKTSQPLNTLPFVTPEFQKSSSASSVKETKVIPVDSILYYYGGDSTPSFSSVADRDSRLPVDEWIAGGMMMRLRRDRHRASQCSRLLLFLVLLPIGLFSIFHLSVRTEDNNDNTNIHNTLMALAVGGILTVVYWYLRECLDSSAIHSVSRATVKQFSALAKERHPDDLTSLHYEVQPGDFLPRTTKGVIRFEPTTTTGGVAMQDVKKKKAKASLAFV